MPTYKVPAALEADALDLIFADVLATRALLRDATAEAGRLGATTRDLETLLEQCSARLSNLLVYMGEADTVGD